MVVLKAYVVALHHELRWYFLTLVMTREASVAVASLYPRPPQHSDTQARMLAANV